MLLVPVLTYVHCAHLCVIGAEPGFGIICCLAVVRAVVFAPTRVSCLVSPGRASAHPRTFTWFCTTVHMQRIILRMFSTTSLFSAATAAITTYRGRCFWWWMEGVVLAMIICPVCVSPLPYNVELLLYLLAFQPMEAHVHSLGLFWDHTSCGETVGGVVVGDQG
eukprot:11074628-Ditylum_brightwellii.AAC.1